MDEPLPIDVSKHPMWKAPTTKQRGQMAPWQYALRKTLAENLTRFEGRDNMDAVVRFCAWVYTSAETLTHTKGDRLALAAEVTKSRVVSVQALLARLKHADTPGARVAGWPDRLRRQMNVIRDLADRLVTAIEESE